MEVFSKSYLEEVVENQGKLFEYAEEHYPGIDVADFIESYMKSYTRAMVDEGQAYVCTMDAETLYNYFRRFMYMYRFIYVYRFYGVRGR